MNTGKADGKTPLSRPLKRPAIKGYKGRILFTPVEKLDLKLEDLVAGITRQNIHHRVDFDGPFGKEAL